MMVSKLCESTGTVSQVSDVMHRPFVDYVYTNFCSLCRCCIIVEVCINNNIVNIMWDTRRNAETLSMRTVNASVFQVCLIEFTRTRSTCKHAWYGNWPERRVQWQHCTFPEPCANKLGVRYCEVSVIVCRKNGDVFTSINICYIFYHVKFKEKSLSR